MTDYADLIRGAIARGWCAPINSHKEMDPDLAEAIAVEVMIAIRDPLSDPRVKALVEAAVAAIKYALADDMDDWFADLRAALAAFGEAWE